MIGRCTIPPIGTLLLCLVVLIIIPHQAQSGAGRIKIEDEITDTLVPPTKMKRGIIDLNVALNWDPTDPNPTYYSEDEMHAIFRTASVMLCDATDGRFRLGNVNFLLDPLGRSEADLVYRNNDRSYANVYDFGRSGGRAYVWVDHHSPAGVVVHELAHHVLGLRDQYALDQSSALPNGAGYPDVSVRSEFNNTITDTGIREEDLHQLSQNYKRRTYCFVRQTFGNPLTDQWFPNGVDAWDPTVVTARGDIGNECLSTEDCLDPNFYPTAVAVHLPGGKSASNLIWGQGQTDEVVCRSFMLSEITSMQGHDVENGLGPDFDQRPAGGDWGDPLSPLTFQQQYDNWFATNVTNNCLRPANNPAPDGSTVCLDGVPYPWGTQQVDLSFDVESSHIGDAVLVKHDLFQWGQTYTTYQIHQRDTLRSWTEIYDSLGIYAWHEDAEYCNEHADSRHILQAVLQYIDTDTTNNRDNYQISLFMPLSDFDPAHEECNGLAISKQEDALNNLSCQHIVVRQIHMAVDTAGDIFFNHSGIAHDNNNPDVFTVNMPQNLRINACHHSYPYGIAEQNYNRDPNPFSFHLVFDINVVPTSGAGNLPISEFVVAESEEPGLKHIGNCEWELERSPGWRQTCASVWEPVSVDNMHEGSWSSTKHTVNHVEWDWATLNRFYGTHDGTDFVTDVKNTDLDIDSISAECLWYNDKDPADSTDDTYPKGAYNVTFGPIQNTMRGVMYLAIENSWSMTEMDGLNGNSRFQNAKEGAAEFVDDLEDWINDAVPPDYPTGAAADVGLITFSDTPECAMISQGSDETSRCTPVRVDSNSSQNQVMDDIRAISPERAGAALHDALMAARGWLLHHDLDGTGRIKKKYIYLWSDGHDTSSVHWGADKTPEEMGEELRNNNVVVFAVAVGANADFEYLRTIAEATGGAAFYAEGSDFIQNTTLSSLATSLDGAVIPTEPLDASERISDSIREIIVGGNNSIITENARELTFDVEEGAKNLTILLSSHGYGDYRPGLDTATGLEPPYNWDLKLRLVPPDANGLPDEDNAIVKGATTMDPEIKHVANSYIKVHVDDPPPGTWNLLMEAVGPYDLRTLMTVVAQNPKILFNLDVSPKQPTDGDTITVTPSLIYDNTPMDIRKAGGLTTLDDYGNEVISENCNGRVIGPLGFAMPLDFTFTARDLVVGNPPTAKIDAFNGRGFYRVELSCAVPENLDPIRGTVQEKLLVPPFKRTVSVQFFYDSDVMPVPLSDDLYPPYDPNDPDGDGVQNPDECTGDPDNDGWPCTHDDDSDDDKVKDGIDSCPLVPNTDQADSDGDNIGDACDQNSFCIFGEDGVWIADNSDVEAAVGSNALIDVGGAVVNGTLISGDTVNLRANAVINGSVMAADAIIRDDTADVNGATEDGISVEPFDVPEKIVPYTDEDIEVSPDFGCELTLPEGSYGAVIVRAGCTLTLTSGHFNMWELYITSDASLVIDGSVTMNVEEQFFFGDRAEVSGIVEPDKFKVYSNQTYQSHIGAQSLFIGNIAAPHAEVSVFPDATFDGCIHSQQVRIEPQVFYTGDSFVSLTCGDGTLDPGEACDDGNSDNNDDCLNTCKQSTCDDSVWHHDDETDVDCGGVCDPCELGNNCVDDSDCQSDFCDAGVCAESGIPISADLNINSQWPEGYCAMVYLTNQGTETTLFWNVTIDPAESTINNLWDGILSEASGEYRVDSESYNSAVAPGQTISFGFCAQKVGTDYQPEITSASAE